MQRYQLEEYDIRYMGSDSFYLPAQLMLSKYDALCVEQFDKIESESTVYVSDLNPSPLPPPISLSQKSKPNQTCPS